MRLRDAEFGSVIEILETLTIEGDSSPRARSSVRFGGGVMVSDGAACPRSLAEYLASGILQTETEPFLIAFRPTGATADERTAKTRAAASLIQNAKPGFSVTFAVVADFSRLSLEDPAAFLAEAREHLAAFAPLAVPIVPEVSILLSPDAASSLLMSADTDALCVADSIAWSEMSAEAQEVFFGKKISPLAKIGGGRVSGKYLLPLTVEWVRQLKRSFAAKPVIAGGGALRPKDVDALKEAGANAVTLDAVRKFRPWNVVRIIRRAHAIL